MSLPRRNNTLVKDLSTPTPGAKDLYFQTRYSQPAWGQFKSCLWKQWWTHWRSPDYNLVRYLFTLACALMVGTIFWRVGTKTFVYNNWLSGYLVTMIEGNFVILPFLCYTFRNSDTDLLTIIGAMYASVLFVGINNCSTVQPVVAIERTVFYRERAAGMYSALPYAMAQVRILLNTILRLS